MKKSKFKAALINLDLQKAFDGVWRNGLMFILWISGIRGPSFKILQTFLKNRLVRTRLEGRLSLQVQPAQGVPQGSVISPLRSIFYIAESLQIPQVSSSSMQMTRKYLRPLLWNALFIGFYRGTSTSSKNGTAHGEFR